jgi:hypothetical protein
VKEGSSCGWLNHDHGRRSSVWWSPTRRRRPPGRTSPLFIEAFDTKSGAGVDPQQKARSNAGGCTTLVPELVGS